MKLSQKVFLAVFGSSLLICSGLIWLAHQWVGERAEIDYVERYRTFSRALGRTLTDLEKNTEQLMANAAKVVAYESARKGVPSGEGLKELRDQLGVTHIFMTDSRGKFIRSTNEAPELIPNLFSFCGRYRDLVGGKEAVMGTPIIPPYPEPMPYKFLIVPSLDRKHLVEVGMRVDFIGKTLRSALGDDPNVLALNVYAPDGTALGTFGRERVEYQRKKAELPPDLELVTSDGNGFRFLSRVESTHPQCCQCDVAGISKDGQYYYVIESVVSKSGLVATLASAKKLFLILEFIAFLIALFVARLISGRLTRKIDRVVARVRAIGQEKGLRGRIGLRGKDEIAFLSKEFDRLLGRLENSQEALFESRRKAAVDHAVAKMAAEVSHHIRSPMLALEGVIARLDHLSDSDRRILRNAIHEVRALAGRFREKSGIGDQVNEEKETRGSKAVSSPVNALSSEPLSVQHLWCLAESVVAEKRVEYRKLENVEIECASGDDDYETFVKVQRTEFQIALSNLINNGVDSLDPSGGRVVVRLYRANDRIVLEVRDSGRGISPNLIPHLGTRGLSVGKAGGSGLGLFHAKSVVTRWGGSLEIRSEMGEGTSIRIELPANDPPAWFLRSLSLSSGPVVVLDDSDLVHDLWRERFTADGMAREVIGFTHPSELRSWCERVGDRARDALFLVDYNLGGISENGLDVIESLALGSRAVLVTGLFDEDSVTSRADWLGVRVLPKLLISRVPIGIVDGAESLGLYSFVGGLSKKEEAV